MIFQRKKWSIFLVLVVLILLFVNIRNQGFDILNKGNINFGTKRLSKLLDVDSGKESLVYAWNKDNSFLLNTNYSNDFFQLTNFYEGQVNPFFCGIATSVIILNALGIDYHDKNLVLQSKTMIDKNLLGKQEDKHFIFYRYVQSLGKYTKNSYLNEVTDSVKARSIINAENLAEIRNRAEFKKMFNPGLTLAQFQKIIESKGVNSDIKHASDITEESFRDDLKKYLQDDSHFIAINFLRNITKYGKGGHFSPVVAYNQKYDVVLVMDVSNFSYENKGQLVHKSWFWIKTSDLFKSMDTIDSESNKTRGYAILSRK